MHTRWTLIVALILCFTGLVSQVHAQASKANAILVVGDSLSAEYGLSRDTGWVSIVDQKLQVTHTNYHMRNSSISGDTSSGGLSRLAAALQSHQPKIVIIELGSNDALRGLSLDMTKNNLATMIKQVKAANAAVLLIGMQIPPNYGRSYTEQFRQMYVSLAQEHRVPLVPFLLEGIATNPAMFQADGIHPNEQAQETLADNVWVYLKPILN